jgi:hypothetical protein
MLGADYQRLSETTASLGWEALCGIARVRFPGREAVLLPVRGVRGAMGWRNEKAALEQKLTLAIGRAEL